MKIFQGVLYSAIIHALIFAIGVGVLKHAQKGLDSIMEIDLGRSSLLLKPAKPTGQPAARSASEPWVFCAERKKILAQAKPAPTSLPAKDQPEENEVTTDGEVTGSALAVEGAWVPVSQATHPPRWKEGLISQADYPRAARRQGKEGRVVVSLIVDEEGHVHSIDILEGVDPFNHLVLEKLKLARFSPACGLDNRPLAVKIIVPIEFRLR